MIRVILWDVDGTLLDFHAAERVAIRHLFAQFSLGECTDEMLARYSMLNKQYWQRLERGEMTKPQILVGRFREFFATEGLDVTVAEAFNEAYQYSLGDTVAYCDDSLSIVRSLQDKVGQYVVSNGTIVAQNKKLRLSGLGELMDGIFLSEQVGAEKPSPVFFDHVFAHIEPVDKGEVLIVGDSLTGDIRGGKNAGIRTCWYNPHGETAPADCLPDYEITDLHQIYELLN
ncbi:MAG: YjjG family noncanonical pyrimidine nucleotidase [Clostridia bacterium]|nr:YjjG family noncanonical pyrimidine nucleotidase [Clostridia bacterium]